jgi:hypothetical protein
MSTPEYPASGTGEIFASTCSIHIIAAKQGYLRATTGRTEEHQEHSSDHLVMVQID